jgi:hypothetical protein
VGSFVDNPNKKTYFLSETAYAKGGLGRDFAIFFLRFSGVGLQKTLDFKGFSWHRIDAYRIESRIHGNETPILGCVGFLGSLPRILHSPFEP